MTKPQAELLFEVSWEICNKVGGIHTVVTTKAPLAKKNYQRYILIGPYFEDKANINFESKQPPPDIANTIIILEKEGIKCHYGRWLLSEEQEVILIDSRRFADNKNKIKESLWFDYRIDSLHSGWEFEEPVIWGTAVGKFIDEYAKNSEYKNIVGHFHEWLAGASLLYLKKQHSRVATVFTTHATILGRSMSASNRDLYTSLDYLQPENEAYSYNIQDKFQLERASAQNADIFTTVSEITSIEAGKILGRKVDILTLNGMDFQNFPTIEEFSVKHVTCREKLKEMVISLFFPYYTFDVNSSMFLFIAGRYEFKNKGIDIFIKSLGLLNQALKNDPASKDVVAFIWIPQRTNGIKAEVLENKNYYRHIKNYVNYNSEKILSNIVHDLVSQQSISKQHIFSKDFMQELKNDILTFRRKGNPPICTHHIDNESNDQIVRSLQENNLNNHKDDKVKIIFTPVYLEGNDGLVNLPYYDAIAGCHLGIFPSYYEPWGYTPLEAASMGVPAITTDLAGFGRFVRVIAKGSEDDGVQVIDRFGKKDDETILKLSNMIHNFSLRDKHQRVKNKISAKDIADNADWSVMFNNYIIAHNMALEKRNDSLKNSSALVVTQQNDQGKINQNLIMEQTIHN